MLIKPKSVIRPNKCRTDTNKFYLLIVLFFLVSFRFLFGHNARIVPSFKSKNLLKNNKNSKSNSNDRFGLKTQNFCQLFAKMKEKM